jgi:hypothetical protein
MRIAGIGKVLSVVLHLGNIGAVAYEVHETAAWMGLASVLVWAGVAISAVYLWQEIAKHHATTRGGDRRKA